MKTFWDLSFKKKVEHIWEYYRWHIVAVIAVACFLGSWIHSAVTYREPILQLQMINAYMQTPGEEAFIPFLEDQGLEYFENSVTVNRNIQFGTGDGMQDAGSAQMLMCVLAAGEADVFFWDNREVPMALQEGALLDLRSLLPEQLLEEQKKNLVYDRNPDTGETYPCGIYMEENPWITEQKYYVNCTAGVPVTSKDPALGAALISWLLEAE